MKREHWIGAVLFVLVLMALCALPAKSNSEDRWVLVFSNTELRSISITKDTRLEYPMVNGHADWQHGRLIKPDIDFDQKGGHYEKRNNQ